MIPEIFSGDFLYMDIKEINIRLDELEFQVLKNPQADFTELTKIIFDRINELRELHKSIKK